MKQESFKKIENESYYTSPPYNYRPSIAEYLSTGDVTKNSFIADIMHLDHKKNIKIICIKNSIFTIKLITDKKLNYSETYVWNYLKSIKINELITLNTDNIPKNIITEFSSIVRVESSKKFNAPLLSGIYQQKIEEIPRNIFILRIAIGFFLYMFGFLSIILVFIGLNKLSRQKTEIKYFLKKFVFRYFKINIIYFLFFIIFIFLSNTFLIKKLEYFL